MGPVGLLLIGVVLAIGSSYALWLCWTVMREAWSRIREAKEAGTVVPRSLWFQQGSTIFSASVFLVAATSIACSIAQNTASTRTIGGIRIGADGGAVGCGISWGTPENRGMLHILSTSDGPQVTGASLCYIRFDNDDLRQLVEQHPQIEWFLLSGTQIDDRAIVLLSKRKSLVSLALTNTAISDRGVVSLKGHPELEELDLANTAITDRSLAVMPTLPKLTHLNLSGTAVTDKGLEFLKGNTTLRTLHLRETEISDGAFASLASLKRLEALDIPGSRFTPAVLARLQVSLPGCKIVQEETEVPRFIAQACAGQSCP